MLASHAQLDAQPPVAQLVDAHCGGDGEALDQLVSLLYHDLRRLAHFELARRRSHASLNTTALVHEAYVKLIKQRNASWNDRAHFLAASARAMRHILVDAARRRLTQKQGSGRKAETLDEALVAKESHALEVLAVDQTLEQLRLLDARICQVVECQFFAGFSKAETARALGVSERTVHRDWLRAKGWLRKRLGPM